MRKRNLLGLAALAGLTTFGGIATATAQDSGALIDLLVRKGIVSNQEAENLRSELTKEFATTSAGKINLATPITELRVSGDIRLRYQYDDLDGQRALVTNNSNQRERARFRLRLNLDYQFNENWFAGVGLETAQASDSGNQTFGGYFQDYNIFISRAYLGWKPIPGITLTGGKQRNPFYTTDLVWDGDINPTGATESVEIHKLFAGFGARTTAGSTTYDKDGKAVASGGGTTGGVDFGPLQLTLNAAQFIVESDNLESVFDNDANTDPWFFYQQLVAAYKINADLGFTIAPGFSFFLPGDTPLVNNENSFGTTPAGGANAANSPFGPAGSGAATRNLHVGYLPGEFRFQVPIGGGRKLPAKFLWDVAYNFTGEARYKDIYRRFPLQPNQLTPPVTNVAPFLSNNLAVHDHEDITDSLAWLVGFEIGQNRAKGDFAIQANYRQTGIASIDPNLNDSDFALGELNTRGFRLSSGYNFTDNVIGVLTYFEAWNLRKDLFHPVAEANSVRVLQADLNIRF